MTLQSFRVPVRLADRTDAAKITTLINAAFKEAENFFVDGERITMSEVTELLEKGEFLVAENDHMMVGCVYLEPRGERTYLGLLSVDPSYQHGGLGSQLMEAAEERCCQHKSQFIDILIVNLRTNLPPFYAKRGYVQTGTSPFPEEAQTKIPCHFIKMSKALFTPEE